jgi:hypothetical protein
LETLLGTEVDTENGGQGSLTAAITVVQSLRSNQSFVTLTDAVRRLKAIQETHPHDKLSRALVHLDRVRDYLVPASEFSGARLAEDTQLLEDSVRAGRFADRVIASSEFQNRLRQIVADSKGRGISDAVVAELTDFVVHVSRAFADSENRRFAVDLTPEIGRVRVLEFIRENGVAVAKGEGITIPLDNDQVSRAVSGQEQISLSQADLNLMVRQVTQKVNEDLEGLPAPGAQPMLLDVHLGILPDRSTELYLNLLISAVAKAKARYGANVYFRLLGNEALKEAAFKDPRAADLFLRGEDEKTLPINLKNAPRVAIAPNYIAGAKNILTQKLDADFKNGDIPAFEALVSLALYGATIDFENAAGIPQKYLDAWSTLANAQVDGQVVVSIIHGTLELEQALKFAVKAITRIPINDAIRFLQLMERMIGQAA